MSRCGHTVYRSRSEEIMRTTCVPGARRPDTVPHLAHAEQLRARAQVGATVKRDVGPQDCPLCGVRRWTPSHALSRFVGFCGTPAAI